MAKNKRLVGRIVGIAGVLICLVSFILKPSFPTPDKLFVFLLFVFLALNQAWEYTRRLLPFVAIILIYESFRSVADKLNSHVHYLFMPHLDKFLFGNLPTVYLQNWWWRGHVQWYDVALYIPYLLFFVVPLGIAILIWKTKEKFYWQAVTAFSLLFFGAFLTFLIYPSAPPWLASQGDYIQPITRISTNVWNALGIHNFPSLYNHLAPNPVAALPSLHAGVSTLSAILIFKLYGRRWGALSSLYPLLIYIGVMYEGEHYATDVLAGIVYAVLAYLAAPYALRYLEKLYARLLAMSKAKLGHSSSTKSALRSRR